MPKHRLRVVGPDEDEVEATDPVGDRLELDLAGLGHRPRIEGGDLGQVTVRCADEPRRVLGPGDVDRLAVDAVTLQPGPVVDEVPPTAPTSSGRWPRLAIPKAIFAAQPPRRTWRSSVRKDSEILASWSTTKESANLPAKVMRWSVAMEPVTAMRTEPP